MQASIPAARISAMARSRTELDGQYGSKVRLMSSSSVVTVIHLYASAVVFDAAEQVRTTMGLRVCIPTWVCAALPLFSRPRVISSFAFNRLIGIGNAAHVDKLAIKRTLEIV